MGVRSVLLFMAVPALLLGIVMGLTMLALKQPSVSEAAVHKLVDLGGIPQTVFDKFKVKDDSLWYDIITKGNLGMAEGYMHGKVELEPPLGFFLDVLNGTALGTRRKEGQDVMSLVINIMSAPTYLAGRVSNQQSRERSTRVTKMHYDAGNDLYEHMLGPTMSYTCAYWKDATTLEEAQTNKFDLIRRKLELKPGMKVADLGMGWGTAATYMHEKGQVDVTGVSLSEQQVKWAQANLKKPGLQFIFQDYREHCADPKRIHSYDRIYSIGMLEHVGHFQYKPFFKCIKNLLKPDGLAVVHTIGEPDYTPAMDPFLDKYIFPGAVIPALSSLTPIIENDFILEDFQNFGIYYARTLAEWDIRSKEFFRENPKAYTIEFQRMWEYYLKMCEALFELRINQLWHFVISPRPAMRRTIERQS